MNIIVIVDKKWGIGKKNGLLFNIPEDMTFFKEKTLNKVVVMGKNTFYSLPGVLKNRVNIVFSSTVNTISDGVILAKNLDELRTILEHYDSNNVFVIGGAQLYNTMFKYCDTAYVTKVDADGGAEVFIENLEEKSDWVCIEEKSLFSKNNYKVTFCTYKNNNSLIL